MYNRAAMWYGWHTNDERTRTMITATELNQLDEQTFDAAMEKLEADAAWDANARRLVAFVDHVVTTYGTYDLDLDAVPRKDPACPYDFAHTRHWCGWPGCRDA